MKKVKRREFIRTGINAAIVLGTPMLSKSCDLISGQDTVPEINAQVATICGDNLDTMTRDALDALGGMQTIVNTGETVFIKPNFVTFPWAQNNNCFNLGECTKPEIIGEKLSNLCVSRESASLMG